MVKKQAARQGEVEADIGLALGLWLHFVWRYVAYLLGLSLISLFVHGGWIQAVIVLVLPQVLALKGILNRDFGDYRLSVIERQQSKDNQVEPEVFPPQPVSNQET